MSISLPWQLRFVYAFIKIYLYPKQGNMHPLIHQMAKEYKSALQRIYGDEFAELVLYGSYARGDYHNESDVDFAVVLHNPAIRPTSEIFKTSPVASQLSLKYGVVISTLPVSLQKKQHSMQWVYQNMRKEGVLI